MNPTTIDAIIDAPELAEAAALDEQPEAETMLTEEPETAPDSETLDEQPEPQASIDPTPEISPIKGEKTGKKWITVPASDEELAKLARQQTDALRDLEALEARKKEVSSSLGNQIKTTRERLDQLAKNVENSEYTISVPTRSWFDLSSRMWYEVRTDVEPPVLVDSREMTAAEMEAYSQLEFFGEPIPEQASFPQSADEETLADVTNDDLGPEDDDFDDSDPFADLVQPENEFPSDAELNPLPVPEGAEGEEDEED